MQCSGKEVSDKMFKKGLVNGIWRRTSYGELGHNMGMGSKIRRRECPTKKEYKKRLRKGQLAAPLALGKNICPTCGQEIKCQT